MTSVLHVATAGSDAADGSEGSPFRTIGRAAAVAQPGDTVLVHGGEYMAQVDDPSRGDHERFRDVKQPVWIRDNVYAAGAGPYEAERDPLVLDDVTVVVVDEGEQVYLEAQLPEAFDTARVGLMTGSDLERVRFVDAEFEETDGSPARLAGPISTLASGSSRTRVW